MEVVGNEPGKLHKLRVSEASSLNYLESLSGIETKLHQIKVYNGKEWVLSITLNPYQGLKPNCTADAGIQPPELSITLNPYQGLKLPSG